MDAQSLGQKRLFERTRYEKLHTGELRTKPNKKHYGVANNGSYAWPQLEQLSIKSLVDIGTGNGAFPRDAVARKIPCVCGVDFANIPVGDGIRWVKAPAHKLPFTAGEFEWLTCFDMLEHLITEEVDDVFTEFRRVVTHGWFFRISHRKSHTILETDLHLTIRPEAWWKNKLSKFGAVLEYPFKTIKNQNRKYLWMKFR